MLLKIDYIEVSKNRLRVRGYCASINLMVLLGGEHVNKLINAAYRDTTDMRFNSQVTIIS